MVDMILVQVIVLAVLIGACSEAKARPPSSSSSKHNLSCLSWRLGVETNNIRAWPTVPDECVDYVKEYMEVPAGGKQYTLDVRLVVKNIISYAVNNITLSKSNGGSLDAWILDVDDTCISNLPHYKDKKRYGGLPYDPKAFADWALKAACPAIPDVLRLFKELKRIGFKVILLTGRDDEKFRQATVQNLRSQGYCGYDRLILRNGSLYKGLSAITYKSDIRKQLAEEGYKLWGNVGDQWSDLLGEYTGKRTFKIPNPMYFVP